MPRNRSIDLLTRPPCGVDHPDDSWMAYVVDPAEQLKSLAERVERGLLTREEYQVQKDKILER
jgi:hypothetical protein